MEPAAILGLVVQYGPWVIATAAAATAALPQAKEPGSPWYAVRSVLDALALNFGNAKNSPK